MLHKDGNLTWPPKNTVVVQREVWGLGWDTATWVAWYKSRTLL